MTPDRVALAERFARKWGSFSAPDESRSIALVSVWKAEKTWKPDGGCSFPTWAGYYCRRYLWVLRRSEARRNSRTAKGYDVEWIGTPPVEQDFGALHAAIAALPPTNRDAVNLVFLQGLSQVEAGRRLGVSHQAIGKRLEAGLKKLKRALKASGVAPF